MESTDFCAKELLPAIKVCDENQLIDESFVGTFEDIESGFDDESKLPRSREIYNAHQVLEDICSLQDRDFSNSEFNYLEHEYDDSQNEFDMDTEDFPEESIEWSIISRNDPCPCGSGKKYKKCCLH